ncbi:DUF7551 domain-containing protein [Halomicrobium katesii]|uniref:DUF7551 domain-containing protein n=1 Tax=Halomicrobium katesii TaxID=437163 RepID=UPI000372757B|nr:hypothetical protein [Halomicrobium katesii]
MIGTTLTEIRDHIESLASDNGEYYLVCARYGDRPVPASELRFETRATARAAAQATTQYRQALRRYDPQLPYYDIVVCQAVGVQTRCARIEAHPDSQSTYSAALTEPVVNRSSLSGRELVEFCHRVAAAVFETLSEHSYDGVESAIMDAYFAHAEELADPDGLCIRLLESMAVELADRLDPSDQVAFLSAAAERLEHEPRDVTDSPTRSSEAQSVDESLSALQDIGLFRRSAQTIDTETMDGQITELVVELSGYVLRPHDGRLPLLPIALTVHRCAEAWVPTRMNASDDGQHIAFRSVKDAGTLDRSGQVFAPEVC